MKAKIIAIAITVLLMGNRVTDTHTGETYLVENLTPRAGHIEALYFDYLVVETADGNDYLLNETGDWYKEDGSVKYKDGEAYTAVIEDGNVVALY